MRRTEKPAQKSRKQTREEMLEDWADIRRWIEDLQQEWVGRQEPVKKSPGKKKQR